MAPPDPQPDATTASGSGSSSSKRRRVVLLHEAGIAEHQQKQPDNDPATASAASLGLGLGLAEGFEAADLRLLEATPEVLAALGSNINGQAGLRIVGCEKEATAALVTADATFELCRVETSNMLLLVPPFAAAGVTAEAVGHSGFHYELKRSKPKVEALKRLLASQDPAEKGRAWTLAELEQRVQGSQAEVLALLKGMNALEVGPGQWRAVEEAAVNPTLDRLLTELLAAGVPLERVREATCRGLMPDVDPLLLAYCLRAYGNLNRRPGQQEEEGDAAATATAATATATALFSPASHPEASFALDVRKIARFKAHQIFREGMASGGGGGSGRGGPLAQAGVWERGAFLLEWEASLPSTHRPDPAWLQGVALPESMPGASGKGEERLRYLPAEAMPLDPAERLRRLFAARKRWTQEEVEPYLRDLMPDGKALGDFLTKHTRAALGANGERTYTAK